EAGAAQGIEGLEDHLTAVDSSEAIEQRFVERLHAHADTVNSVRAKEFRLIERDGGGIALDGELLRAEETQALHCAQDGIPLLEVENGRCAAAEENRARSRDSEIARDEFQLAHERMRVAINQFPARSLGKEGAIRAFLRAERHMNVKALDAIGRFHCAWKLADAEPISESKHQRRGVGMLLTRGRV